MMTFLFAYVQRGFRAVTTSQNKTEGRPAKGDPAALRRRIAVSLDAVCSNLLFFLCLFSIS